MHQAHHLAGLRGWRAAPGLGPLLVAPGPLTAEPRGPGKEAPACCPYRPPQHGRHQAGLFSGVSRAPRRGKQHRGPQNLPAPMSTVAGAETPPERISKSHGWEGVERGWNPCLLLPGLWGMDRRLTAPCMENNQSRPGASVTGLQGARKQAGEAKTENILRMQTAPPQPWPSAAHHCRHWVPAADCTGLGAEAWVVAAQTHLTRVM